MWTEDLNFATGTGNENGYQCYAQKDGKLVFLTNLQRDLFLANDILVLVTIAVSFGIMWWSFDKEVRETRKVNVNDELGRLRAYQIAYRTKLGLYKTTGWFVGSYVILRVPWMFFANANADRFSAGMRIAIILYFMKFSVLFFLFGHTNKNYRKAYLNFIKLIFPCFRKKEDQKNSVN